MRGHCEAWLWLLALLIGAEGEKAPPVIPFATSLRPPTGSNATNNSLSSEWMSSTSDEPTSLTEDVNKDEEGRSAQSKKHEFENGFSYRGKPQQKIRGRRRQMTAINAEKGGKEALPVRKMDGTAILMKLPNGDVQPDEKGVSNDSENRQYVAGLPDMSDRCFRRYASCIIVNAQPYERRSNTELQQCKRHCLESQLGVYSCRSFVFDNINQICDLFAHVGDHAPARLLKFQTRDYYEPTFAKECDSLGTSTSTSTTTSTPRSTTTSATTTLSTTTVTTASTTPPTTTRRIELNNLGSVVVSERGSAHMWNVSVGKSSCAPGESVRYLLTTGFELHNYDHVIIDSLNEQRCLSACTNNKDSQNGAIECRSIDYTEGRCVLSRETAVPLGNGQLKQKANSKYYEKICVDESATSGCPLVSERFPQMILVGFAETVIDAASFEICFESCINSHRLFGIKCASGMYYFEEPQLNCILNVEDRHTQEDLFAEESSDIVDYFETGCTTSLDSIQPARHKALSSKTFTLKDEEEIELTKPKGEWSEWSECSDKGVHVRTRVCGIKTCGTESKRCRPPFSESVLNLTAIKEEINAKGIHCAPDVCCEVFGGCRIGLLQNSVTQRLEWCQNPCKQRKRKQ